MGYETLRLCTGRAAFEAIPNPKLALDLGRIRSTLEGSGVPVVDARVMLMFRLGADVTLGRDGRVLIKTSDPKAADAAFRRLDELLGLTGDPASAAGASRAG